MGCKGKVTPDMHESAYESRPTPLPGGGQERIHDMFCKGGGGGGGGGVARILEGGA